jgi:hypothetical protein
MSKKTQKEAERAEAIQELRKLLKPGMTVRTILRHVSSSGMSRTIDLVIPTTRVDTLSLPAAEAGKALKIGASGYGTTGERRFVSGRIVTVVIGQRVTFEYDNGTTETFPLADAKVYAKSKPVPVIRSIGWLAARAMGDTYDRDKSGIKIGGCGMDMGFALVYNLGSTLWPKGTPKPHGTRNGEPDRAGGYALKQDWL